MKTQRTLRLFGVGLAVANLALLSALAGDMVDSRTIKQALSAVPTPELGSKAAALVKQAPAKQAEATTKEVVLAAIKISPTTTVPVVGAISKENFEVASVAAGTAAAKMPRMAPAIAKAAAAAAPSQAGKIVLAVCKEAPKNYRDVALAVAEVVPSAGKDILDAVATAIPALKASIVRGEAAYASSVAMPVGSILQQAETTQNSGATGGFEPTVSPPPTTGLPFVPLTSTPGEVNPGDNSNQPPGGRDYSQP